VSLPLGPPKPQLGSHVPWRRWSSRSPQMHCATGAAARLGCAAPPELPLVSHGSSSKPLASDAPRCRSHSCLPCRQSTELSSTCTLGRRSCPAWLAGATLTSLARGVVAVWHALQSPPPPCSRGAHNSPGTGGWSVRASHVEGWMRTDTPVWSVRVFFVFFSRSCLDAFQKLKFFHSFSITSIFGPMHGVVNVGKKITNYTV
jgi:hypothetical protein